MQYILPLDTDNATLANSGGKGLNLTRLVRAGLPVPAGFIVITEAYRRYVAANELYAFILDVLNETDPSSPDALDAASDEIRSRFAAGTMPADLTTSILAEYEQLRRPAAAVRSSATAEDLPDMSFAGQQDTYLNVVGDDALLEAVVGCWSSLWTARAIGYRSRNDIDHRDVALAAVVQKMVPSEASGVLFTANPLTGRRDETVIDATLGLGEALVAGQVEPDHYVVHRNGQRPDRSTIEKELGAKAIAIEGDAGGGTVTRQLDARERQALPDDAIVELAHLGRQVTDILDGPQDIEWAWADDTLHLLQSRPITSLYPLPDRLPAEPPRALMSFGAAQGMLDPITPLGRDVIYGLATLIIRNMGYAVSRDSQRLFYSAGERIFVNVTGAIRSRLGRRVLQRFLILAEPSVGRTLETLRVERRFSPTDTGPPISSNTLRRIIPFVAPILRELLRTLWSPDASRRRLQNQIKSLIGVFRAKRTTVQTLADCLDFLDDLVASFPVLGPQLLARVAAGILSLGLVQRLTGDADALVLTRGLPHNVTTEMDLVLWETAQAIREDPAAAAYVAETDAATLADEYLAGTLPVSAQTAVSAFLDRYGMRGVAEIDIGRPRWRDDPTPVIQTLRSYLQIDDPEQAPDAVFARGAKAAEAGIDQLAEAARDMRGGPLRAWFVRKLAYRVRAVAGLRESPKFFIVRLLGLAREELLDSAHGLAADGILSAPDDIFFLRLDELRVLAAGGTEAADWQGLVAERRRRYERERQRRQIPRVLLSDGRSFYEGVTDADSDSDSVITGSPVSPGTVEGTVRVVLDPHGAELEPGEILVCPATDPGWTPLFLAAGGLVMEVGGLMTHGSVVAREYGIPAVVGVQNATERLKTGQRVRVDGSTGRIDLLE